MEQPTDWIGIATAIAAFLGGIAGVIAAIKTGKTHDLVNSRMTQFMERLDASTVRQVAASEAVGALRGQREEKADQALRDMPASKPVPGQEADPPTIELEGKISGSVETKK